MNYGKLITEIKKGFGQVGDLTSDFHGEDRNCKNKCITKVVVLFQALPIVVSNSIFKMLDKIIFKFVWKKKKAIIKYRSLLCPKEKEGLSLLNLKKLLLGCSTQGYNYVDCKRCRCIVSGNGTKFLQKYTYGVASISE